MTPDLPFIKRHSPPTDAITAALEAVPCGWSDLSVALARYLVAKKGAGGAVRFMESLYENIKIERRKSK